MIDSRCFFYSNEKLNWNDARNSCKRKGATLIVPSTDKEYNLMKNKNENVWIGAQKPNFDKNSYLKNKDSKFVYESNKTIPKQFWFANTSNISGKYF